MYFNFIFLWLLGGFKVLVFKFINYRLYYNILNERKMKDYLYI